MKSFLKQENKDIRPDRKRKDQNPLKIAQLIKLNPQFDVYRDASCYGTYGNTYGIRDGMYSRFILKRED